MTEYYQYYYINSDKQKDGPHDLVTMMRRIRTGIITAQTLVYRGYEDPTSAHVLDELAHFFNNPTVDLRSDLQEDKNISIAKYLSVGWEFVSENPMTAFTSGLLLCISGMVGWLLNEYVGVVGAFVAFWVMLNLMQGFYFVVSIRLYRGQRTDIVFIEKMLTPIWARLLFISLVFSALIPFGSLFLVVPALLATLLFVFSSFFMLDHHCNGLEAISEAWKLMAKLDNKEKMKLCGLVLIYMVSVVFIIPIPLMLPIFAGAMCCAYEDLIKL
jgi:hypothetical protein